MILTILLACSAVVVAICNISVLALVAMDALQSRKQGKESDQSSTAAHPTVNTDPIMDDLMRIMTYTGADDHE